MTLIKSWFEDSVSFVDDPIEHRFILPSLYVPFLWTRGCTFHGWL